MLLANGRNPRTLNILFDLDFDFHLELAALNQDKPSRAPDIGCGAAHRSARATIWRLTHPFKEG